MSTVKDLHRRAMEVADLAFDSERKGDSETARRFFDRAADLEAEAASLADLPDAEPTRSILFRSAATLAIHAGKTAAAERIICRALAGSPPPAIADELRSLYEQVNFYRHLEVRGVELSEDDFQMSLVGPSIGPGFAPSNEFLARVDGAEKLVYRTAERKMGRAYRMHGPVPKEVSDMVSVYLSMPRAASFAVSFRVGGQQQKLPGMSISREVITEIIDCLDHFTKNEEDALSERIPEDAYFTNFVSLAKSIAPDGKDVDAVGFTAVHGGRTRSVTLKAEPVAIRAVPSRAKKTPKANQATSAEPIVVAGTLQYADKKLKSSKDVIILRDDSEVDHVIVVPPGMMNDIVTHLWDNRVQVTGVRKGKRIYMTDVPRLLK